jgi:hypothetical protein
LGDEFVQCRVGFKVVARIVQLEVHRNYL